MTMTHKEALDLVMGKGPWPNDYEGTAKRIRAYIEARGLVLVPKKMTWTQNNALNGYCLSAAEANAVYDMALAATPDPFEEGE